MLKQKTRQLNKTKKEFRKFFLLQFTRELIKNSGATDVFKLESILKEEKQEEKDNIKGKINLNRQKINSLVNPHLQKQEVMQKKSIMSKEDTLSLAPIVKTDEKILSPGQHPKQRVLRIPRPRVPPQFDYLKPIPTKTQIDLGKLNPLISDPVISIIECDSADENIIVKGSMGIKKTNIKLTKEDIKEIINKFSEKTKIPVQEGVFKVAVGKLIFTAIISEIVSSRFIIRKMKYNPNLQVFRR
ncbi:hypothetical protein BMS3Abin17_00222 [archaeon BMS3Abin17]|nr:hypothetical protein BMS3Abin17_00222 [archaeon BMS3Abin17]HDZ60790.1 hypothetical protein [Candidatus Pacearchaeota archaeon]